MRKIIFFFLAVQALICACQSNSDFGGEETIKHDVSSDIVLGSDYYLYDGQRVNLLVDSSKYFIVYNSKKSIENKLYGERFQLSVVETRSYESSTLSWAVVSKDNFIKTRSSLNNTDILYSSPLYISQRTGKSVGVSNLIHIKLKKEADKKLLDCLEDKYKVSMYSQNKQLPLWFTVFCYDNTHNVLELCRKIQDDNMFACVEPDIMVDMQQGGTTFVTPNDPLYQDQWNLHGKYSVNWEGVSLLADGNGINIGLIDTGVESLHPDFSSGSIHGTYDAYANTWYTTGLYGWHGTACAGLIAAIPNNKKGIVGIAPKVSIDSYADPLVPRPNATQNLASDLCLALSSDDVVSCSWGGNDLNSSEIKDAIEYYAPWGRNNKGTVVVFSAGNNNGSITFPANYSENILVVGAVDKNGNKANFSNYGKELDVMAPGVSIVSTGWTESSKNTYDYIQFSGTSASCPQVAAIAALILSVNPNLTSKEVCDIIEKTAQKVGNRPYATNVNRPNGTWNEFYGYGLVDAHAAVKAAKLTLK